MTSAPRTTNTRAEALRGLRDALPIILAYVPIGATFGVAGRLTPGGEHRRLR